MGTGTDTLEDFLADRLPVHVSRGTVTAAQGVLLVTALSACAFCLAPALVYLFGAGAIAAIWLNRTERYVVVTEQALLVKPSVLATETHVIERARIARCTVIPTRPWRLWPEPTLSVLLTDGRTITLRQLSDGVRLADLLAVPHR